MKKISIPVVLWLLGIPVGDAHAEPVATRVMVRAVSRDAMALTSKVGGARITIRDAKTGKLLAEGVQQGGSGDKKAVMQEPRRRGQDVFDTPETAGFLATVSLERPTTVEITAEGPLSAAQATQRSSKTVFLVPGQHVLGDGVLLEIHGFIVDVVEPSSDASVKAGADLPVKAKVLMS
jgi:hypothetical protein